MGGLVASDVYIQGCTVHTCTHVYGLPAGSHTSCPGCRCCCRGRARSLLSLICVFICACLFIDVSGSRLRVLLPGRTHSPSLSLLPGACALSLALVLTCVSMCVFLHQRYRLRVLLPGAGLGRLTYDIGACSGLSFFFCSGLFCSGLSPPFLLILVLLHGFTRVPSWSGCGWRVQDGGWRVEGGGWRVEGGG